MTSESIDQFFTWLPVCNTTEERSRQNSISDDDPHTNKIRESTKKINEFLKTSHITDYSIYVKNKKKILSKIKRNSDVFHASGFSDSELKTYYGSFKETRPEDSVTVHDDLFVWAFVEKRGMKIESVDTQKDSIWEPVIDISTDNHHGKYDSENQGNKSYKAAGALLIRKRRPQKKNTPACTHYNTRSASKNSIKNNTSRTIESTETPANAIEKVNDSDANVLRSKKFKNAKRNLRSVIDNVSSQVSETSETNLSCDFIPEDFQAHSTQIFSDTLTSDANVPKSSRTSKACKFSSNDPNNQPRDSGIEEDSRDENTAQENIENVKGNSLLKKNDKKTSNNRKVSDETKNKKQNLSSRSTESCNMPRKKQYVKIIGEETITRKYKIISKNTSPLQPIVEEKPAVPLSELNVKSSCLKQEPNSDSENDFKSGESGDEEESNNKKKEKESSDGYYDVHDDNNALSSEDEKVSPLEGNGLKNKSAETNTDSDSQDSRHRRRRLNKELKNCTSPWVIKQYNDLKRLRLLEDSQDDSEFESYKKNESGTAKQTVSVKSKKASKNITNEIEKLSNKKNKKSDRKKLYINGTQIDSNTEMNSPQVTNSDIDPNSIENLNVEEDGMMRNASLSHEKEKSIENSDYSNSKLESDSKEYSKSDTTGSHKSLQKNKKLKHKKKRKVSTTASVSSRENSYEKQTQHSPKDVKIYKHSPQSEEKTKSDHNDSENIEEDVDALPSKSISSSKDSSALSVKDIVKSKQAKKNGLKNEIFTSSDDEKESEDEKMSENQKENLQNVKKIDLQTSDESSDSEADEKVDLHNQNQLSCQKNEEVNEKIIKESYEPDDNDEFDSQEMKEPILPHQENENNESDEDDECLPTQQAQEKLKHMKRLTFDDNSESEDSDAESVSMHKHKSQLIKSERVDPNVNEKSESVHEASSDEERDEKDTITENQKLHLQPMKKMDLKASDESSDSETECNNADLQSKEESSCRKNEKTVEKDAGKSKDIDGQESNEESDESDKEDEVIPTQHAQKKLQQMKRLKFDDDSESEESVPGNVVISIHKSQATKSVITKEKNIHEKSDKERNTDSEKSSDEEDTMSENQKRKLQNCKKMDLLASDESSASEAEHEQAVSRNEKVSTRRKNGGTREKSHESDDVRRYGKETKETVAPRLENHSDESDKEDEVMPTQHAQKKLQQMKRLNFDKSSESEDSETESALINKHKTQVIKSQVAEDEDVDEVSERVNSKNSEKGSDEEGIMSKNQKNHLQKMKKMDLMASDKSEESDKDRITKSKRGKLSEEKEVKSDDSEDDDKTSDAALQEKLQLNKSRNANSSGDSDSDSVHYDSDNIDVKEHKVIVPEDLKNSNLLEHFNESNTASSNLTRNGGHSEALPDRRDENKVENNEDEEIDNIVPVEVTKRMQQLKRLNLYDKSDSSDSDESTKNHRHNTNVSQKSSTVPRKERDDSSSDEKESITEEPTTLKSNVNESVVNNTKEEIEDNVADEKELEKAVAGTSKNVIIPETQESEDFASGNNQSQEMFSSLENLAESSSQNPVIPERDSKKPTTKITEVAELVEQEGLIKSSLEPTLTLDDIDSDEEIFVIEVPKNVFDAGLIGKKLVVTKSTLSIGDSHYEAVKKDTSPVMSCVLNSKRKKYKTVNVRPLRSIVARRKKDAEDYIENAEIESRHKNQHSVRDSDQESIFEARVVEPPSMKNSQSRNRKLSHTVDAASSSSVKLEEKKMSKKKSAKNKEMDPHDLIRALETSKENTEHGEATMSKSLKRKLYASDHEIKDVDSNATDDSLVGTNSSLKKPKISKKVADSTDKSAKPVEKKIRKKVALKNLNVKNNTASAAENENNVEVEITEQTQTTTKARKKSNKKATQQDPEEECDSEKVINTLEDDKEMFENMFRESYLVNISTVEEEVPVKKKAKKRKNTCTDVNPGSKAKTKKKSESEEVNESANAVAKPKRTRKKVEKPKEEPASVQIMKFISDAFKFNGEKLNASTSSNESRYGVLDIERVSTKKNYSSSSSSDESEEKYAKPSFQIRDKSKEKDLPGPSTSSCGTTLLKQEVKDEKKKIKKIVFDE